MLLRTALAFQRRNIKISISRNMSVVLNKGYIDTKLMKSGKAYIDGKWVDASNGATFEVRNPANGQVITSVPDMTTQDGQNAIDAAYKCFYSKEWTGLTAKQRSSLLKNWFHLIEQNAQQLAEIMTAESGKPISESKGELTYGNSFIEWFAEEARRIYGEVVPSAAPNRETIVIKQPIGVVALITPWNFPLAMITRKASAALAAGCTVVIKPSEDTPLTALALTKLAEEAGLPKGAMNVITMKKGAPFGDLICKSPKVQGISFTGSTEVGRLLYRQSADGIKRVSLELGGNAPFIVFESADLDKAVEGAMVSKFRNCGQACVASNRFFVQESVYDAFVEKLKKRVAALKIGPGTVDGVQCGPLVNKMQFDKVKDFVEDARNKNANILLGGKSLTNLGDLFYEPTIVADVPANAKIYDAEVFGPIVSIFKFKTEEEVIKRANNTQRGLAGYFYSENLQQVFRVARRLEVGMVGVNEGLISTTEAPFGGVKESGIGREGSHYGIDEYTEIKYICLGNLQYN